MGIFDTLFKPKIGGVIASLGLQDWYLSLTPDEQENVNLCTAWGDRLLRGEVPVAQTQMSFIHEIAQHALREDPGFAVSMALKGLEVSGSLIDKHFLYNTIIMAYDRKGDYENAKKYCLMEVDEFEDFAKAWKDRFPGLFPEVIPCRDVLLKILIRVENDYDEAERLINTFVEKGLLTSDDANHKIRELRIQRHWYEAKWLLDKGDFDGARTAFDEVLEIDNSQAPIVFKALANYLYDAGRHKEALEYFQQAIAADPLIKGVRTKIKKLAKKLGTEANLGVNEAILALEEREATAKEWWEMRDLANEYAQFGKHDRAWKLYIQAKQARWKDGGPCDTIYPYEARLLYKEKRYRQALTTYLFACSEGLRFGSLSPPKSTIQGIDRCLKKLGNEELSHIDMLKLVEREKEPRAIMNALEELLPSR